MWHYHKAGTEWKVEKVIEVKPVKDVKGWEVPVPGLITDLVLSMDDRYLYFSNWLHGDIRQYDVSDPANPRLTGQIWLGGLLGKAREFRGKKLGGGPQMLQLSLDGKRLYVTNSLVQPLGQPALPPDRQGRLVPPADRLRHQEGWHDPQRSCFHVDFGKEPDGPAAPMRFASRTAIRPRISGTNAKPRRHVLLRENMFDEASIGDIQGFHAEPAVTEEGPVTRSPEV